MMDLNFTEIMNNFIDFSTQGYTHIFSILFWPIVFTAIIGYVYMKQQSIVAAAVATLLIFAAFGSSLLMGMSAFNSIMLIFTSLALTALVLLFISKVRG